VEAMIEGLAADHLEIRLYRIPSVAVDAHVVGRDRERVEAVGLAAPARRGRRARLDDERGMPGDAIALGRMGRVRGVEVPREEDVRAALGEGLHRLLRAAH